MSKTLVYLHPLLAFAALALFLILGIRLLRRSTDSVQPFETLLAQGARISMLLIYLTGLMMSYNLRVQVAPAHHWTSLLPVGVLFVFQFLPSMQNKPLSTRGAGWMFICQFVAFLIISAAAFLPL